jgi:hypothetical protein
MEARLRSCDEETRVTSEDDQGKQRRAAAQRVVAATAAAQALPAWMLLPSELADSIAAAGE